MNHIQTKFLCLCVGITILSGLVVSPVFGSSTSIINNMSISSKNGEASIRVYEVVDGEVVTDYQTTSTEPILYTHTYTSSTATQNQSVDSFTHLELQVLLAKLLSLLSLYEHLYQQATLSQ